MNITYKSLPERAGSARLMSSPTREMRSSTSAAERPGLTRSEALPTGRLSGQFSSADEAGRVHASADYLRSSDAATSSPAMAGSTTAGVISNLLVSSQLSAPETARPVHRRRENQPQADGATSSGKRRNARATLSAKPTAQLPALPSSAAKRRRTKVELHTCRSVSAESLSDVQSADVAHMSFDIGSGADHRAQPALGESPAEVHGAPATHFTCDFGPLIDEIREQWRVRQHFVKAMNAENNRAFAYCMSLAARKMGHDAPKEKVAVEASKILRAAEGKGNHELAGLALGAVIPTFAARDSYEPHRKAVEKRLAKLAEQLPVSGWLEEQRGVGIGSLAAIVGEAGNIGNYGNPAKLWKRMGMAVMGDGKRQRKVSDASALVHGYSPRRRSVMWNIGDCMVKAGGPWRELYDQRKAYEITTAQAQGLTICPSAKIPKKNPEAYRSDGHVHNRAKRYIEKRFLRSLWSAWRRANGEAVGPVGEKGAVVGISCPAARGMSREAAEQREKNNVRKKR